jgi:putative transposase
VAADLRSVFNAPNREEAERLLSQMEKKYKQSAPRLSSWLSENVVEGLTVMGFPKQQQWRLRTSNLSERINRELKRRTRVVSIFPNPASLERLVTGVLMEIDEDWQNAPSLGHPCFKSRRCLRLRNIRECRFRKQQDAGYGYGVF